MWDDFGYDKQYVDYVNITIWLFRSRSLCILVLLDTLYYLHWLHQTPYTQNQYFKHQQNHTYWLYPLHKLKLILDSLYLIHLYNSNFLMLLLWAYCSTLRTCIKIRVLFKLGMIHSGILLVLISILWSLVLIIKMECLHIGTESMNQGIRSSLEFKVTDNYYGHFLVIVLNCLALWTSQYTK